MEFTRDMRIEGPGRLLTVSVRMLLEDDTPQATVEEALWSAAESLANALHGWPYLTVTVESSSRSAGADIPDPGTERTGAAGSGG